MSRAKHEGSGIIVPKDQIESSFNDEGCSSGSSLAGEKGLPRGPNWTPLEDAILVDYVSKHGTEKWKYFHEYTGLPRGGNSCRLRWVNHLSPDLKKGALTPEEQKLIIHLHSKIGNKWAKMATFLSGRTDNAIKNYWHARSKRRLRLGLPLYPRHVLMEAPNQYLQTLNNRMYNRVKRGSEVLQGGFHDFSKPFKANPFSDISFANLQSPGLDRFNPGTNHANRTREFESCFPGNHGRMAGGDRMFARLPHGPDSFNNNLVSLCSSKPDCLIQPNGNFSTSIPLAGTLKFEHPSIQYPEPTPPPPPPFIQSPPMAVSTQSHCASPSSGLLETLIQESHAISPVGNYSADPPGDMPESSMANLCGIDWEGLSDPNSPFRRSDVPPFSECAPINNSSLDEHQLGLEISTSNVAEKDITDWLDAPWPDVLEFLENSGQ